MDERETVVSRRVTAAAAARSLSPPMIRQQPTKIIRWEKNNARVSCFVCGRLFGYIFCRRHHCRWCGRLVCGSCAPLMKGGDFERICQLCTLDIKNMNREEKKMSRRNEEDDKSRQMKRSADNVTKKSLERREKRGDAEEEMTPKGLYRAINSSHFDVGTESDDESVNSPSVDEEKQRQIAREKLDSICKVADRISQRLQRDSRGNDGKSVPPRSPALDVELMTSDAMYTVDSCRRQSEAASMFSVNRLERWERRRRLEETGDAEDDDDDGEIRWSRERSSGFSSFSLSQDWELDPKKLRLVRKVAAGSTSVVWLAKYDERDVAVKQPFALIADGGVTIDFAREVEVLSQLAHPFVLSFVGLCFKNKTASIVTEWCQGELLAWCTDATIRRSPTFASNAFRIATQVAQGMRYLHARHVVHMDLKPANILLTVDGIPKIADYGLSRLVQPSKDLRRSRDETRLGSSIVRFFVSRPRRFLV